MKYLVSLISLLVVIQISGQDLPDPVLELGLVIGEPTGLSAKYWLTSHSAVDASAGWSSKRKLLDLCMDYQYHYIWSDFEGGELPLFIGGGIMARLRKDFLFGVRLPLGSEFLFEGPRLVFFAQVAPVIRMLPKAGFFVAGGFGIRYAL